MLSCKSRTLDDTAGACLHHWSQQVEEILLWMKEVLRI